VTGATGFIGSEVVPALLDRGIRVRVLALAETVGDLVHAEDVEVVVGGLADDEAVREALASVSTVYHLAGVLPGASRTQLAEVNVRGTELLLRACRDATALERLVFTSSVAVYEGAFLPDDWPITELSRLEPGGSAQLQAYGQSKVAAERLARHHAAEGGFGCVILRPATSYGPGNRGFVKTVAEILERPRAGSLARGRFPSQLLHGRDLAEAVVLAGTHPQALDETFNLAGEDAVDGAELAALVRRLAGLQDDPPEPLASAHQWRRYLRPYDTRKAQRQLGFHPRVPLREGLAEVVAGIVEAAPEPAEERTACASS
jgi:nucleoside-diphosphate-sugar epimerase